MEENKIKITCPLCKKAFLAVKPEKPGTYKVLCPNAECAREIKVVLRPHELKLGQGNTNQSQQPAPQPEASKPSPQPEASHPAQQPEVSQPAQQPEGDKPAQQPEGSKIHYVGKPEKTDKGIFLLKTPLVIGEKSAYTCPGCGKNIVFSPKTAGALAATCPACSTRTAFRAMPPTPEPTKEAPSSNTRRHNPEMYAINGQKAMLVWGSIFRPHKAEIKEGITWVGRNEPTAPSDVMIDDKYVSAHSFFIEKDSQRGICTLKVVHATNPVTVNGVECKEGNSVYLKFGDKIKAGKTILVLTKSK